jgi:small subunit ribosomal protein S7
MRKGKKTLSYRIFYSALSKIRDETQSDPLFVFEHAIRIVTPTVQLKSCRVGGATYQIPVSVSPRRGTATAIQWILTSARTRSESGMDVCLSAEILDIVHESGGSVRKRDDTHRIAESNKAFASYRL